MSFTVYVDEAGGAVAAPTISEVGSTGIYQFEIEAGFNASGESRTWQIDTGGTALVNGSDQYGATIYYDDWVKPATNGAESVTLTINAGGSPVPGVRVDIKAGSTDVDSKSTNSSGQVTFNLDAGSYTAVPTLTGYTFPSTTITVSAPDTVSPTSISGSALTTGQTSPSGLTGAVSWTAPTTGASIAGLFELTGDIAITRTLSGIPGGTAVSKAYLTFKCGGLTSEADSEAVLQEVDVSGSTTLTWSLSTADTQAIRGQYEYDIRVILDDASTRVVERGSSDVDCAVTQSVT
jgi:hypothetical protein